MTGEETPVGSTTADDESVTSADSGTGDDDDQGDDDDDQGDDDQGDDDDDDDPDYVSMRVTWPEQAGHEERSYAFGTWDAQGWGQSEWGPDLGAGELVYSVEAKTHDTIGLYVDTNENRVCDPPGMDVHFVWRDVVATEDFDVSTHSAQSTVDLCPQFFPDNYAVTVTGSGYDAHVGQTVNVGLFDSLSEENYTVREVVVGEDGRLDVAFGEILTWFVDDLVLWTYVEANGVDGCQADEDGDPGAIMLVLDSDGSDDVVLDVPYNPMPNEQACLFSVAELE